MPLPVIRGVIERRLLINYRVHPEALAAILPAPFRPQVVRGFGLAGICLIRLGQVRPRGFPVWCGLRSENAAHRVAVEWTQEGKTRTGVYVLRRETNAWLNAAAGGRIFPGVHELSRFRVRETARQFEVAVERNNGSASLDVKASTTNEWPADSVFESLAKASSFFAAGSLGYSLGAQAKRFEGLELRCRSWDVLPLQIKTATSAFFDNPELFPEGALQLDCGLVMRGVEHEWHKQPDLPRQSVGAECCSGNAVPLS